MERSWKYYLTFVLCCIVAQAFFAMLEMACVSFNKVRLQYYVNKGSIRALWLSRLLNRPAQLFGTTLIGVNTALQMGSEASRRFYEALQLDPDVAPLTQVVIVLIFAELAPLFAGRRYAEHVAMLGIPIIYVVSIILRPIIWLFDLICRGINHLVGAPGEGGLYVTREELQKILEEKDEGYHNVSENSEFDTIVSNIFSLKNKTAKEMMLPLEKVQLSSVTCKIGEMRQLLEKNYVPYLPLYHRDMGQIVAIAYPRDLLRLSDDQLVKTHARSPWFITENNSILQILKQFRRNNQSIAVVLNEAGSAVGILTLDEIIDDVFGQSDQWMSIGDTLPRLHHIVVDRTFPGDMKISEFNEQFHVHLESDGAETLEELVRIKLGHPPEEGESIRIDQFELTVEEATILGAKMVAVRSVY